MGKEKKMKLLFLFSFISAQVNFDCPTESAKKLCEDECIASFNGCLIGCNNEPTCVQNCVRESVKCEEVCPCHEQCYEGCPCEYSSKYCRSCEEINLTEILRCDNECTTAYTACTRKCPGGDQNCKNECLSRYNQNKKECPCEENCPRGCPRPMFQC